MDEALAWMLSETELDIVGRCLRLPFPACAFVFTDPGTLDLGGSLLSLESTCPIRDEPLRILTAYVTRGAPVAEAEPQDLNLSFLFRRPDRPVAVPGEPGPLREAGRSSRGGPRQPPPRGIARRARSRLPRAGAQETGAPRHQRHPLRHLGPPRADRPAPRGSTARRGRRARAPARPLERRAAEIERTRSAEDVYHLPGHIDISRLKQLRALPKTESGRALMARFMVRGHWRRANPDWKDQRLRWIEPYWKGPELAAVIERDYRLKP